MGSSEASATALRALLRAREIDVVGVVTQPDRPSGRHQRFTPCACKAYAWENGIGPIITPEKVNAPEVLEQIEALQPEVIVVVAFGQFLGKRLLALPRYGCINGHFSLLPLYRGAAPVQASIAAGDDETGVTIIQMAPGMDDGDMLMKGIEPIYSDDTSITLMERLAILNAYVLVKTLRGIAAGTVKPEPQNHAQATFAPKLQKSDGLIDWRLPARLLERRTRSYEPWPGAFTYLIGNSGKPERVRIISAEVLYQSCLAHRYTAPGTICELAAEGPIVATCNGMLLLTTLQPDGGRRMDGRSFLNGRKLKVGQRFFSITEE